MIDDLNLTRGKIFLLVIISLTVVTFTYLINRRDDRLVELRETREQLKAEQQRLQERHRELTDRVKRLRHDPYFIKRLAREKLGLKPPGEHTVESGVMGPEGPFNLQTGDTPAATSGSN